MRQNEQIEYAAYIVDSCTFPLTLSEKVDMIHAMVCSIAMMAKIEKRDKKYDTKRGTEESLY